MSVQIVHLAPIPVIMLQHVGSYDTISAVFDQLCNWAEMHGVPVQRTIGIYWDNPDYVPQNRLRSAACIDLPAGFHLTDTGGLPLKVQALTGGEYATTTFVGPYEDLAPVWTRFTNTIEGPMHRRISQNPAFEIYLNDPSTTPPDQLITELYMPLA